MLRTSGPRSWRDHNSSVFQHQAGRVAVPRSSWQCGHSAMLHASSPCTHVDQTGSSVLEWATGKKQTALKCQVQLLGRRGRGLVAIKDIAPGEVILSVPYSRVYSSQPEAQLQLHWSAELAARLLQDRAACNGQLPHSSQPSPSSPKGGTSWCTWLRSLPANVVTPLEFTELELAAIGDPAVAEEVEGMQACIRACHEELQGDLKALGFGWSDFLAAVQVLHSRSFFEAGSGCHLAVPGVDMANHDSVSPSAVVAIQHSPGAVQGWDAVDEVCDPATLPPPQPDTFNLVAREQGISAGSEITISYGPWPDQAFFLLFGFLPEVNPHNACILFPTLSHIVHQCVQLCEAEPAGSWVDSACARAEEQGQQLGGQFIVSADGWDGRMAEAVAIVHQAVIDACRESGSLQLLPAAMPGVQQLVAAAVQAKLHSLLAAAAQAPADAAGVGEAMKLATAFRSRQLTMLQAAAASMRIGQLQ